MGKGNLETTVDAREQTVIRAAATEQQTLFGRKSDRIPNRESGKQVRPGRIYFNDRGIPHQVKPALLPGLAINGRTAPARGRSIPKTIPGARSDPNYEGGKEPWR